MFRPAFAFIIVVVALSLIGSASAADSEPVGDGGACRKDADCAGNLDCIRTGLFERHCFPVSCAKGAAQALLDYGFKAETYIATIQGRTGLRNRDFLSLGEADNQELFQALAANPPPIEVFNRNYTACLHPDDFNGRALQQAAPTAFGLMWSGAALFSYFGKSSWYNNGVAGIQIISNCVGGLLGVDVGLDVLFQVFSTPGAIGSATTTDSLFFPVFTLGPIGVQVGWSAKYGPNAGTITEITLGPSLGLSLAGFNQCFNSYTSS